MMSNAVDAAAPARCAGGAVVSRRVGGVLTGVLAPLASSRAPSAARAAPPHAGDGGKSGRARIGAPGASGAVLGARAVVRLSSPGEDCGGSHERTEPKMVVKAVRSCHPLAEMEAVHAHGERARR